MRHVSRTERKKRKSSCKCSGMAKKKIARSSRKLSIPKATHIKAQKHHFPKCTENISQVVQIDGVNRTFLSAFKKTVARTKPPKVGTKSQVDLRKTNIMTPQQMQTQFGSQWYAVQTTAGGSDARPTRQHPELGQDHRAHMEYDEVLLHKHSNSDSFLVLGTRSRISRSERGGVEQRAHFKHTPCTSFSCCPQTHYNRFRISLLRCHFQCCCGGSIEPGWKQAELWCAEKCITVV